METNSFNSADFLASIIGSMRDGDIDRMMAHFSDNVVALPPDGAKLVGKEAIRPGHEQFLGLPDVEVDAKLLFDGGNFETGPVYIHHSIDFRSGGAEPTELGGEAMIIVAKEDGTWRIAVDVWNPLWG